MVEVLANVLKWVLLMVISKVQNVFVEGRQILNAVLVANEAVDLVLRVSGSAALCKLDLRRPIIMLIGRSYIQFCDFCSKWGLVKDGLRGSIGASISFQSL